MITRSAFTTSWWLRNRHIQTILPFLVKTQNNIPYRKQRLELPDGDFADVFWCEAATPSETQPIVIVTHGMGGCFDSHYVPGMVAALLKSGFKVAFLHARGCSGEPNRLPVTFNAADTSELNTLVAYIKRNYPGVAVSVVGFSLGGSILVKWLAETSEQALLSTAVAVSVPFDLSATANALNHGFSRVYQEYLVRNLKSLAIEKAAMHPPPLGINQIRGLKTLREYDDRMTAKINGFGNVDNYYTIASAGQYLRHIRTPLLVINALDDPFIPRQCVPSESELSAQVTLEISDHGGHVGFLQNTGARGRYLDQRVPGYLRSYF